MDFIFPNRLASSTTCWGLPHLGQDELETVYLFFFFFAPKVRCVVLRQELNLQLVFQLVVWDYQELAEVLIVPEGTQVS